MFAKTPTEKAYLELPYKQSMLQAVHYTEDALVHQENLYVNISD